MVTLRLKAINLQIESFFENALDISQEVMFVFVANQLLAVSFKQKGKRGKRRASLETLFRKIIEHISKNTSTCLKELSYSIP